MKKFTFFLCALAILSCIFAISIFADEAVTDTFYVVSSQDSEAAIDLKAQGKDVVVLSEIYASTSEVKDGDWIAGFESGSHIELIFAENIIESVGTYVGILIDKAITLTVRYNGFAHLQTNNVDKENTFVLKHSGAKINLIGTSEIYDENGEVIKDFTYNSSDLSKNKVQIRHSKVYCWIYDGDAYVENIRSYTGQELIYVDWDNSSSDGSAINTYEFKDCALSSGAYAIGLLGQSSAQKIINVNGGYYNKIVVHSTSNGSYIKNCSVGSFEMDCWNFTNQILVFENVVLPGSITTKTGRTHLKFVDCTIDPAKFSLGSDGGGACYALVYTSPSCEGDGILNVYRQGKGATPVNDDSRYADVVTEYYANPQNKALGHNFEWKHNYDGEKYLSGLNATYGCTRCDLVEKQVFIGALFNTLGFSVPQFGGELSITVGYAINKSAIAEYESLTGNKISFGCAIAVKDCIGEGVAPLDENGNAIVLSRGRVVVADATNEPNSYMDVKINLTSDHIDTQLLITGYIAEMCGDSLSISYMQSNNMLVEENQFSYVSYNNH